MFTCMSVYYTGIPIILDTMHYLHTQHNHGNFFILDSTVHNHEKFNNGAQ